MGRNDPAPHEESEDEPDFSESVELVRRSQTGDDAAREALVARYYVRVQAMVRKRMGADLRSTMESGDLVQEVMLNAARAVDQLELRSHAELVGWFARVVENAVHSARRRTGAQKRDRKRELSLQDLAGRPDDSQAEFQPEADDVLPPELAALHEEDARVRAAMAELEEPQRRVLELRAGQGLTWAEIAERVGLPSPDAARMLYVRAGVMVGRKLGLSRE
ncbi:MAG TPA: sigma-70 family RNA polymerase sigma factor [Planctomycetota bacterium]|nr:sigma-70 family RNA polymerase sigma factor [Planctomycetota bacterium]